MKNVILTTCNDVWRRTSKATVKTVWHILYHFFIYFVSYLFDIFKSVAINIYFFKFSYSGGCKQVKVGNLELYKTSKWIFGQFCVHNNFGFLCCLV